MFKKLKNYFTKSPTFEFVNIFDGVNDFMPIIPSSSIKHNWIQKASDSFSNLRKNDPLWNSKYIRNQTIKCPAIFKTTRLGWVLRNWQDFAIITNGSNSDFEFRYPKNTDPPLISYHHPNQYHDFMDSWRDDTLHTIVKYQSGWRVYVPENYFLLEMPVAFSDENRFTVISGVFDGSQRVLQLNVQLLWHVKNGTTVIKQGTPISQYIPIKKEHVNLISREKTTSDRKLLMQDLADTTTFVRNYQETFKFYKNSN